MDNNMQIPIGRIFIRALLAFAVVANLSACDDIRSKLASLIAPAVPRDVLKAANTKIAEGNYKEARNLATAYADKQGGELQGEFAYTVARASAFGGDAESALKYLVIAVRTLDLSPDVPMSEPAFESLRTHIAFVQIITGSGGTAAQAAAPEPAAPAPAAKPAAQPDTSASIDSSGVRASAGNVSVKISP